MQHNSKHKTLWRMWYTKVGQTALKAKCLQTHGYCTDTYIRTYVHTVTVLLSVSLWARGPRALPHHIMFVRRSATCSLCHPCGTRATCQWVSSAMAVTTALAPHGTGTWKPTIWTSAQCVSFVSHLRDCVCVWCVCVHVCLCIECTVNVVFSDPGMLFVFLCIHSVPHPPRTRAP